ncbi:hypothetical protein WJU23_10650 [Prosthecobacter sp. SYSU 5D2]|uniref:hypothetical protein n=1 Tax=Prosthecobacter sp. SYSU 5D2 TaxID=3134134 RepID=UPI0031FE6D88
MSAPSEFVLREEARGTDVDLEPAVDFEPSEQDWKLALEARERWLKGEEEVLTLEQLKKELQAELLPS